MPQLSSVSAHVTCFCTKSLLRCTQITEREFHELFPGQVVRVGMVHDTTALDPLVKEYEKVKRQLEDLLDEYIGRKKQLKKIKRRKVSPFYVEQ